MGSACEPRPVTTDAVPPAAPATPDGWGDPRSRTVTWHDPMITAAGALERSGLETMAAIRDGVLPPPPIAKRVQMGITALEEGRVEFTCELAESVYNPSGVGHGGPACTMLGTVAGCAVHTTRPAGTAYTSIELKVSYLRAVHATSGPRTAIGRVVKAGRRVAFAEGEVLDAAGRTVATASSSLLVFPIPAA